VILDGILPREKACGKDAPMKIRLFAVLLAVSAIATPTFAHHPARPLASRAMPRPVPAYLQDIIREASATYHVDPNLIAAVAFKESRYNPKAVSRIGAEGIMQLKPKTARSLGVTDSFDPRQNVLGGTKYLSKLLRQFDGNIDYALAAYNAGPTLVAKVGPNATAEAIEYVATIKKYYRAALSAAS
jgi:soluble lytic murein transglycosylase-like protein